jgi:hypothetical protein
MSSERWPLPRCHAIMRVDLPANPIIDRNATRAFSTLRFQSSPRTFSLLHFSQGLSSRAPLSGLFLTFASFLHTLSVYTLFSLPPRSRRCTAMKASYGIALLSLAGFALATSSSETPELEERTFTVSVGAMLEAPGARLTRRSADLSAPLIERALGRETAEISLDERGNVVFPELDGSRHQKRTWKPKQQAKSVANKAKQIANSAKNFINAFSMLFPLFLHRSQVLI